MGPGAMVIWDSGTCRLLEGDDPVQALETGKIVMELHGKRLKGGFTLVKMKANASQNFLLKYWNYIFSVNMRLFLPSLRCRACA